MKKLLYITLLFILNSSFAMNPTCSGDDKNNWNNVAVQVLGGAWYEKIKFCALVNKVPVNYTVDDFLSNRNQLGGKDVPFISNSVQINQNTIRPSGVFLNSPVLNENFKTPPSYYLQENNNNKVNSVGKRGIFRFLTRVGSNKGGCGGWEPYDYKWIRKNLIDLFLKKLKVNNSPLTITTTNLNGSFAMAENVALTKFSSTIITDIYFIEGRLNEQKDQQWNWFTRRTCALDVYAKLVLKPESSPDFNRSGSYDLKFTWQP